MTYWYRLTGHQSTENSHYKLFNFSFIQMICYTESAPLKAVLLHLKIPSEELHLVCVYNNFGQQLCFFPQMLAWC